jgi:hypothetical protein
MVSSRSGTPAKKFSAADEQRIAARLVDGFARGLQARYRRVDVVKRLILVAGRILDGKTRDTRRDRELYALKDARRVARVAAFEIRVDRHIRRRDEVR